MMKAPVSIRPNSADVFTIAKPACLITGFPLRSLWDAHAGIFIRTAATVSREDIHHFSQDEVMGSSPKLSALIMAKGA